MNELLWLPDVLADTFRGLKGFQVDVIPGWEKRSAQTTAFKPVGVMNHHTGKGSYGALLNYMAYGSSIAPLCHVATSRPHNGVVRITVIAAGRANHAGVGYLDWLGVNGGNAGTIGNEHQNDGFQSWPSQQLEAIHRLTAAELRQLGKGTDRMTEHKIYASGRKIDRHSVSLSTERLMVEEHLNPPIPKLSELLGEVGMKKRLAHIGKRGGSAYELIDDPSDKSKYALKHVPNAQVAVLITNDTKWYKHTVVIPTLTANSLRKLG